MTTTTRNVARVLSLSPLAQKVVDQHSTGLLRYTENDREAAAYRALQALQSGDFSRASMEAERAQLIELALASQKKADAEREAQMKREAADRKAQKVQEDRKAAPKPLRLTSPQKSRRTVAKAALKASEPVKSSSFIETSLEDGRLDELSNRQLAAILSVLSGANVSKIKHKAAALRRILAALTSIVQEQTFKDLLAAPDFDSAMKIAKQIAKLKESQMYAAVLLVAANDEDGLTTEELCEAKRQHNQEKAERIRAEVADLERTVLEMSRKKTSDRSVIAEAMKKIQKMEREAEDLEAAEVKYQDKTLKKAAGDNGVQLFQGERKIEGRKPLRTWHTSPGPNRKPFKNSFNKL